MKNKELNDNTVELEQELLSSAELPDAVKSYLREIGQFPLLTAEEEQTLSLRIQAGKDAESLLKELEKESAVELDTLREYRALVRQGEEAKDRLIQCNLRLVVVVAKKYLNRGLPFLDLIQEGNLGLMKAAEKYDASTGNRFSTVAAWWIRQTITRAVTDTSRAIRLPSYVFQDVGHVRKAARQLREKLHREPTVEEIAGTLKMKPEKVKDLMRVGMDTTSLDLPVGDDETSTLADFAGAVNPMEEVNDRICREQLKAALSVLLSQLGERERQVLELHYGMNGHRCHTLEEIGGKLGLTRERVRQIELRALRLLRNGGGLKKLENFIA